MKKKLLSVILTIACILTSVFVAVPTSAVSDADFVAPEVFIPSYMPTTNATFLENNVDYVFGQGTRYEQKLHSEFISASNTVTRPGYLRDKCFIVVHNTGSYPTSANAYNMFSGLSTSTRSASWHFSAGNDGVYQSLPINEVGWHAGGNYWGTLNSSDYCPTDNAGSSAGNYNSVGIETCVDGFPASSAFSGEKWNTDEMYEWYENHYDKTATYLAQLVAHLCIAMNFNPYTQIIQHFNTSGKNCPMQMRYVFGTAGTFVEKGTYYKVFLDRMYDYYEALGGSYVSTDTFKNTYSNSSATSYKKGLYSSTSAKTLYRGANTSTGSVGTLAANQVADVQVVSFNWGKVTLANGTSGWVQLSGMTYVGNTYRLGTYRTGAGEIIEITNISGTTGTYSGGTVAMSSLTKVYKVTVTGSAAFGSASKYVAAGETVSLTADAVPAGYQYDRWEVTYGAASFANANSATTTMTLLGSDVELKATYTNKYSLTVQNGSGSGSYEKGTVVEVYASPKVGYEFASWKIISGSGTFADVNSRRTTFTTTEQNTVIGFNVNESKELDVSGLTNYSQGKSYTFKQASGKAATYYSSGSTSWADTGSMLTNGVTVATDAYNDSNVIAVTGTGTTYDFIVDLGQMRTINKILICDTTDSGGSWADYEAGSLAVAFSADGTTYTPADNVEDMIFYSYIGTTKCSKVYTHGVDVGDTKGRYYKISFKSSKYILALSEIKLFGSEAPTSCTVTFKADGTTLKTETVSVGGSATAPAAPAKEGYVFTGWDKAFTNVTGDITVNAVYTAVKHFDADPTVTDGLLNIDADSETMVFKGDSITGTGLATRFLDAEVNVTDAKGNAVTNAPVGTGYMISSTIAGVTKTYTVILLGDTTGDAQLSASDYLSVLLDVSGAAELAGAYATAGDVGGSVGLDSVDYITIVSKLNGAISTW